MYLSQLQPKGKNQSSGVQYCSPPQTSMLYIPYPQTVQLMGVDLLRQQQRWKSTLMDIRHMMASLIQEGFNPSNMKSWRLHWDHQLYKALEHQYQMGLESLNENLPEIKIELIYRYCMVAQGIALSEVSG